MSIILLADDSLTPSAWRAHSARRGLRGQRHDGDTALLRLRDVDPTW